MGSKERAFAVRPSGCTFSSSFAPQMAFPLAHRKQADVTPAVHSPGPCICKANVPKQVPCTSQP